jgi:hypothetical protein
MAEQFEIAPLGCSHSIPNANEDLPDQKRR